MMKKQLLAVAAICLSINTYTEACTTFAIAKGEDNIYLAKSRDMIPDRQAIMVLVPKKGYKSLLLVSKAQKYAEQSVPNEWAVRSGVNQKNLAIVNSFVAYPFIKANQVQDKYNDGDDFMRYVLTNYSSVKQVLTNLPQLIKQFNYPESYLLADNQEVANLEVAYGGKYKVATTSTQLLVATNHYLLFANPDYKFFPESASTYVRYKTMTGLLNNMSSYNRTNLLSAMNNNTEGDNNSILRTGNPVTKTNSPSTLAQFLVQIPRNQEQDTDVYIHLINVNEVYKFKLNTNFWDNYSKNSILSLH